MPDIALRAEPRSELGSPAARRARTEGRVPAVIYGHGQEPLPVTLDARELWSALAHAGGSVLFNVRVGSTEHLAIAREVQRHPVRQTVSHVDFQVVGRDEVVPAEVAITLVGEALKVTRAGGVVEHALLALRLHAKPADVPTSIEIDISDLEIGTTIRVSDLPFGPGVTVDIDGETPVAIGSAPRGVDVPTDGGGEEPTGGASDQAADEAARSGDGEAADES